MGKNHRHKKQLKLEKAKIKLKTSKTKFLPKGQNVTNLLIKVKPIVLPEQLKKKENEIVSSRKLNLKEILNRLNHYNAIMKYENCQQLEELICMENNEFLKQNLSKILASVCPLTLDKERKVRRQAIKVLNKILKFSTSTDITSFFGIFSSFLRCVMTHIDQNVQEDSLLLLDALLMHVPDLVAKNSNKILINFFTLISKLKSDSKHTRTLTENLKSKYTGVKWRIQVLCRLKKILQAMYDQNLSNYKKHKLEERIMDTSQSAFAPIYVDKYESIEQLYKIESYSVEHIENYVDTLMPLLNETWLEVTPSVITSKVNFTTLKEEIASTLHCLLTIFYLLYQLADFMDKENNTALCLKFNDKVCTSMFNVILQSFPYLRSLETQKKKEHYVFNVNNDVKCIEENLLICYLFCVQNRNIKGKESFGYAEKILEYLNFCFSNTKYIENDRAKLLLSIVKIILEKNLPSWRQANLQLDIFIENTLHYYLHYNLLIYDNETELLFLLYDIMNTSSDKQELIAEKSCSFLLTEKISSKALDSLLLLVKKNVIPLQECVRKKLKLILDNIKTIQVLSIELEMMKIVRILSLFYYVPLNDEDVQVLLKFGQDNTQYNSVINSIIGR